MKNTKWQRGLSLAFAGVLLAGIIASFAACGSDRAEDTTDYSYSDATFEQTTDAPVYTEEPATTQAETATVPETEAETTAKATTQKVTKPVQKPVTTTKKPTATKPAPTTPVVDPGDEWIKDNIPADRWQSRFGYMDLYDMAASAGGMYIISEKMIFNYRSFAPADKLQDGTYKEKAWRIQLWKGLYNIYLGSEIGVYTGNPNTPHTASKMYKCAEDNLLPMQHTLYHNGKKLFTTKYRTEWWDTGFVGGSLSSVSDANIQKELCMKGRIAFPDTAMMNAFLKEFEKAGFVRHSNLDERYHYITEGKTVRFTW